MFTPEMLQKGLTALGIAAGQWKDIEPDTKKALVRFFMAAFASGDANAFIKERLGWIEARDLEPAPAGPARRATARVVSVEGEFDEGPAERSRPSGRARR